MLRATASFGSLIRTVVNKVILAIFRGLLTSEHSANYFLSAILLYSPCKLWGEAHLIRTCFTDGGTEPQLG